MKVRFFCPGCEKTGTATTAANQTWRCPSCDHQLALHGSAITSTVTGTTVMSCAACGNHELYKKKAFPHWLGMLILLGGIAGYLILNGIRLQWWAWSLLLGSWAVDCLLYLGVKDAVVCYRCGACHSGIGRSGNLPFELTTHERYRQERIQLEEQQRSRTDQGTTAS